MGLIEPVSPGRERSSSISYTPTEGNGVTLTAGSMSVDPCSMAAVKRSLKAPGTLNFPLHQRNTFVDGEDLTQVGQWMISGGSIPFPHFNVSLTIEILARDRVYRQAREAAPRVHTRAHRPRVLPRTGVELTVSPMYP